MQNDKNPFMPFGRELRGRGRSLSAEVLQRSPRQPAGNTHTGYSTKADEP